MSAKSESSDKTKGGAATSAGRSAKGTSAKKPAANAATPAAKKKTAAKAAVSEVEGAGEETAPKAASKSKAKPAVKVEAKSKAKVQSKSSKAKSEAEAESKSEAKAKAPAKAKSKAPAKAKKAATGDDTVDLDAESNAEEVEAPKKQTAARKKKATAKSQKSTAKTTAAKSASRAEEEPEETDDIETAVQAATKRAPKRTKSKGTALVVVESPAKARTIGKYLGAGYTVKASVGHIKDLPKNKIGVDIDNNFEPEYVVIRDKKKVISEIRKAAESVEEVYLAPDPDREGEAIAWHIAEEIKEVNPNIKRILINEITKKGISQAMSNPTVVNTNKTDAQQARRILDRLVGYEISPILWKKVRRGLSAGRVQSVAVRLLVEREQDIAAFTPVEYWSVECQCETATPPPFAAKLNQWNGEKAEPKTQKQAEEMAAELRAGSASVAKVETKERRRRPQPPFITSKLQQEASRKLRFTAKRTMALAQRLYEGVDVGDEGPVGLITYMRTDSTRISDDAMADLRAFIGSTYGQEYLPEKPIFYKSSKRAQDAHEAIRPTSMRYTPEVVARALSDHAEGKELVRLYTLIWQRFVASQMAPAVYDQTTVDIARGRATLRANGQVMKFAGFTQVYTEQETDDAKTEQAEQADRLLPPLEVGMAVRLLEVSPEQHFTQPPPRFTEASLVKELEDRGIGRPSTYASILSTIVERGYVEKKEGRFTPTELGTLVNSLLVESFPDIMNVDFTADMEADLDKIEDGQRDWRELLGGFYQPFKNDLEHAKEHMRDIKREEIPTDHVCEKCGSPMVIKWGRNGSFLACQSYPECRNTKEISRNADGAVEILPEPTTEESCPECSAPMKVKRGRFGEFLACSRYPECKTTMAISVGVACPREGCDGFLTQKRSKRGKPFYGCSNYSKTNCDFVLWDRPVKQECPQCGASFLVKKENKRGASLQCVTCDYKEGGTEDEENAA